MNKKNFYLIALSFVSSILVSSVSYSAAPQCGFLFSDYAHLEKPVNENTISGFATPRNHPDASADFNYKATRVALSFYDSNNKRQNVFLKATINADVFNALSVGPKEKLGSRKKTTVKDGAMLTLKPYYANTSGNGDVTGYPEAYFTVTADVILVDGLIQGYRVAIPKTATTPAQKLSINNLATSEFIPNEHNVGVESLANFKMDMTDGEGIQLVTVSDRLERISR